MNKRIKKIISLGAITPLCLTPLTLQSCYFSKLFGPAIPNKKNPSNVDESTNPNVNNNPDRGYTKPTENPFEYNGIKYNIANEDTYDLNTINYADDLLKNDAKVFKSWIPKKKDYELEDLWSAFFPTIARISNYIRALDPYHTTMMSHSKDNKEVINWVEYHTMVTKILDILKASELNDLFKNGETFIGKFFNAQADDWYEMNKKDALFVFGEVVKEYRDGRKEFKGFSPLDSENRNKSAGVTYATLYWKLERTLNIKSRFDKNELFLWREFYGKKLDPKKHLLDMCFIDWNISNNTSSFGMQIVQWNMLIKYLEFCKKVSESVLPNNTTGISDESKSLKDNIDSSGLQSIVEDLEKALLDYLKLEQILGFCAEPKREQIDLQMFPGGSEYKGEFNGNPITTDFRDTYRWAHYQYHKVIAPMWTMIDNHRVMKSHLEKNFVESYKDKYEMIWANIKHVDNIEKPYVISEEEAIAKWNLITKEFKDKFNWKWKE
ncbi:hypothetical protein NPA07_03275 [Mycoplasmopsis caviae]|uniref:Lipoprotein n=1 Tax=Mycoplasmopsis caviae TaxID=55603 RepID=A0A3P8KAD7_9BACT|nr:hypothetical protein [Mycoplasmopsis caviae]UUD34818.1 hypothetical protein NPA07_03275 [Mycoplasmopsis caviae]VDR42329.1 Uncharacterised protein [Mycoplasmopsis caviae]